MRFYLFLLFVHGCLSVIIILSKLAHLSTCMYVMKITYLVTYRTTTSTCGCVQPVYFPGVTSGMAGA